MDFKQFINKYFKKAKSLWKTGKLQQSSRIIYDIVWNVILFFIIVGVIGCFFALGAGAGYFASLVKDEPVRSYESMEKSIYNYEETSKLYFADNKYIGNIRSDLHREEVKLENISDTLIHAVIATEDQNFMEHEGIVPKAIVRAIFQEITNAAVKTGGSTLTQQLIKNQILTNEVSFERKAKEILLALRLERFFDKDQILEAYLNIVPYGRDASGQNIAGIQTAARGIFGVDADELNLPQAAYLAGLPQSPSYYTPFKNDGGLKDKEGLKPGINRMKTVLERMYEAGYITEKEYKKALNYDIVADFAEPKESPIEKYPYLTFEVEKRAKEILSKQLAKEDGYTEQDLKNDKKLHEEYMILADRALRQKGYEIHTTINKEIYDAFQEIAKNFKYYGPERTKVVVNDEGEKVEVPDPVQVGGMLIENKTGRIISFVGGRGYSQENQLNYATSAVRSNGSTMKPLLVYGPAFEEGVVQPGTPIADVRTYYPKFGNYSPDNYTGNFHGLVSARKALAESYNVPAIEIYSRMYEEDLVSKYLEPMGIHTLDENEYSHLVLAIGSTNKGVTVEANINAYTTFANKGKFIDAYMIEKITTKDGEIVYEHKSEPVDVFSPQTAYLTTDVLRDVLDYGTATFLQSHLNTVNSVDWAGKSGTSENWHDAWFVGYNPNVTIGTWMGYDEQKSLRCSGCTYTYSQRNELFWAKLVNKATEINPELMAPDKSFEAPKGIVSRSYCAISGLLPSDLCQKAGLIKSDIFNAKYVPTKRDDSLITGTYTVVNGKAVSAGSSTPQEFTNGGGLMFNPEFLKRNGYDRLNDITDLFPYTNRSAWEKIGIPSAAKVSSAMSDDGKQPAPPSSAHKSGSKLVWNQSTSGDVVGYRIYRASHPGQSFTLMGNTTSTSYQIPNQNAVYIIKAVDYFGKESQASNQVVVGNFTETKDEKADKPPNNPDSRDKQEKPDDQVSKNSSNGNKNDNNNSDTN